MSEADDFDAFYRARFAPVVRRIHLATGDLTRAEDVVQEAFVRAWQHWSTMRDHDPRAWVEQVAWRLAIDGWRRTERFERILKRHAARPRPAEPASDVEHLDAVLALLRPLSTERRMLLVLIYFDDRSVEEAALTLGIPLGTAKSRLARALASLRNSNFKEGTTS